jgi:hypothetical protein
MGEDNLEREVDIDAAHRDDIRLAELNDVPGFNTGTESVVRLANGAKAVLGDAAGVRAVTAQVGPTRTHEGRRTVTE